MAASPTRHHLALDLIEKGGSIIRSQFGKHHTTRKKKQHDFVTEVDLQVEQWYREQIHQYFPEDGVLGEEQGFTAGSSGYTWIMDPLDGTNNFARGIPLYGTIIAIQHHQEIIGGYLQLCPLEELYFAQKGKGAYLLHLPTGLKQKIHVSDRPVEDAMFMHSFYTKHDDYEAELPFVNNLHAQMSNARGFFCAAYNYAFVASGKAELEFAPRNNPWDVGAGCLLVQEAGGTVTDYYGESVTDYTNSILASNGVVHETVLEILKKTYKKTPYPLT